MRLLLFIISIPVLFTSFSQQSREKRSDRFSHTLGTYTDPRDGKTYVTINFVKEVNTGTIERTWFAENAQYEVDGSKCYNNTDAYCDKYGRLYNYEQASKACPPGWHVPTIHEWKYLFHFFGGWNHSGKFLFEGQESDMDMFFGGFGVKGDRFEQISSSGNWWDNELKDSNSAGIITLKNGDDNIYHERIGLGDDYYLSSRCVKFHN